MHVALFVGGQWGSEAEPVPLHSAGSLTIGSLEESWAPHSLQPLLGTFSCPPACSTKDEWDGEEVLPHFPPSMTGSRTETEGSLVFRPAGHSCRRHRGSQCSWETAHARVQLTSGVGLSMESAPSLFFGSQQISSAS